MDSNFEGKRALVTGAGKGIGRSIAIQLAECGAKVIAVSRTQDDLDTLKQQVPSIETYAIDLTEWDATRSLLESLGHVDLLVNNAGVITIAPFLDFKKEDMDKIIDTNFKAVFNISQVIAKDMVERGEGGAIVMVSSVASLRAVMNHTAYSASKGALDQFTRCLALELGPHKIRVNSVNPVVTMTDLAITAGWGDPVRLKPILDRIPIGHVAEPEDVVNATLFLLSDKSSMLNGVILPVDGGISALL